MFDTWSFLSINVSVIMLILINFPDCCLLYKENLTYNLFTFYAKCFLWGVMTVSGSSYKILGNSMWKENL